METFPLVCTEGELKAWKSMQNTDDVTNGTINFAACITSQYMLPMVFVTILVFNVIIAGMYYWTATRSEEFSRKHQIVGVRVLGKGRQTFRIKRKRMYSLLLRAIWMAGFAISHARGYPAHPKQTAPGDYSPLVTIFSYSVGGLCYVFQTALTLSSAKSLQQVVDEDSRIMRIRERKCNYRVFLQPSYLTLSVGFCYAVQVVVFALQSPLIQLGKWNLAFLHMVRVHMVYGATIAVMAILLFPLRYSINRKVVSAMKIESGVGISSSDKMAITLKKKSEARKKFKMQLLNELLLVSFGIAMFLTSLVSSYYSALFVSAFNSLLNSLICLTQLMFSYLDFWKTKRKYLRIKQKMNRARRKYEKTVSSAADNGNAGNSRNGSNVICDTSDESDV